VKQPQFSSPPEMRAALHRTHALGRLYTTAVLTVIIIIVNFPGVTSGPPPNVEVVVAAAAAPMAGRQRCWSPHLAELQLLLPTPASGELLRFGSVTRSCLFARRGGEADPLAEWGNHALGPLRIEDFAKLIDAKASTAEYVESFARHLEAAFQRRNFADARARREHGVCTSRLSCSFLLKPARCAASDEHGAGSAEHFDLLDSALLDAMAGSYAAMSGPQALADHLALRGAVRYLRAKEDALEKHTIPARKRKCREQGHLHGYSCNNFVYGSTYFASWLEVIQADERVRTRLREVAADRVSNAPGRGVVLGSSLGWQTLYLALGLGVGTRGYELLESRHEASVHVAGRFGSVASRRLSDFVQGDAALADLSKAHFVYLTDLAWEDRLHSAVMDRLAEAPLSPLIVTNRGEMNWTGRGFERVLRMRVRASWMESQRFDVLRSPGKTPAKATTLD